MENGNAPATKGDIEQLRSEITFVRVETKLEISELRSGVKQEVAQPRSEMSHHYHDLMEQMRDSETTPLKAFYSFAQTESQRMTELEGNDTGLRHRIGTIENRLLEVEKRLNIPPAA